jgi:hypothetical protein
MVWLQRALLVPVLFGIGLITYRAIKGRGGQRLDALHWLLMWLYPLGMTLKLGMLGPWWLRWYLQDVGFPLVVAFVLWVIVGRRMPEDGRAMSTWLRQLRDKFAARMVVTGVGVLISIIYEIVAHFMVVAAERADPEATFLVGKFDPVDVACYVAGGLMAVALFAYGRWRLGQELATVQEDHQPDIVVRQPPRGQQPRRRRRGSGPHGRQRSHKKRPH